jgi:hypothetical protein
MPPEQLILGVPIVVVVPALVELMKRVGLPSAYAGLAAMGTAVALVALTQLALAAEWYGGAAGVLLAGVVYGLASAGLYSQVGKTASRLVGK